MFGVLVFLPSCTYGLTSTHRHDFYHRTIFLWRDASLVSISTLYEWVLGILYGRRLKPLPRCLPVQI